MKKETWNILGVAVVIAILMLLITLTGCESKESEPVECADCGALEALLHDSVLTNSSLLCQRSENSDTIDEAIAIIKSLGNDNEALKDELLKANAEIVTCWKLIATAPAMIDYPELSEHAGLEFVPITIDPVGGPKNGHLRWVWDKEKDDEGHLELVVGNSWISLDDLRSEPNTLPQWGKGDLPAEFQGFFGDSNGARLDFMQNQVIDRHDQIIREIAKRILMLEGADPNEVVK